LKKDWKRLVIHVHTVHHVIYTHFCFSRDHEDWFTSTLSTVQRNLNVMFLRFHKTSVTQLFCSSNQTWLLMTFATLEVQALSFSRLCATSRLPQCHPSTSRKLVSLTPLSHDDRQPASPFGRNRASMKPWPRYKINIVSSQYDRTQTHAAVLHVGVQLCMQVYPFRSESSPASYLAIQLPS
jgi:hypothetical protein